jgi:hypothetical protein
MNSLTIPICSVLYLGLIHISGGHGLSLMAGLPWTVMTPSMSWRGLIGKLKRRMMRGCAGALMELVIFQGALGMVAIPFSNVKVPPLQALGFNQAMSSTPPLLVVSSVLEWDTLPHPVLPTHPSADTGMDLLFPKLTTVRSASLSTLQKDATKDVSITMSALSVLHPPTMLRNAPLSEHAHTPLQANAFASALASNHLMIQYPDLVHNIIHGFPIGLDMPCISQNFLPPNHYKTSEEDGII